MGFWANSPAVQDLEKVWGNRYTRGKDGVKGKKYILESE